MNKPKLFVHIGTQKTGTTTIQNTLENFSRELRDEGIIYLGRCRKIASKYNIARSTEIVAELVKKLELHIAEKIREKSFSKNNNYVISNEKFTGDKFTGYKNTGVLAKLLYDATKNLDVDVKIIVYIRRQDDFFESTYAQRIFKGETFSFESFLNQFDSSAFHWDELLDAYAYVFGKENISVKRYGKQFLPYKDSLINSFGEIIGSNFLKKFDKTPFQNTGYRKDTLEFARRSNDLLSNREVKKLRVILKQINSKSPYEQYSFFNDHQRDEFLSMYSESNARVAQEYFNDPSGKLFSAPSKVRNSLHQEDLSPETYVAILTKTMLLIHTNLEQKLKSGSKQESIRKRLQHKVAATFYKLKNTINHS